MIDLKELKRLAEGADAKNNPFDDSGEMYLKALAPVVVLQLIKEHQEMREALEIVSELWMEHGCINQQCVICKIYEAAKIKEALTQKAEE